MVPEPFAPHPTFFSKNKKQRWLIVIGLKNEKIDMPLGMIKIAMVHLFKKRASSGKGHLFTRV
jgi:hypothetical protein